MNFFGRAVPFSCDLHPRHHLKLHPRFSLACSLHSIYTVSHRRISLARCQLSVTYSFQTGVREQQAVRRFLPPNHLSPVIYFMCLRFTTSGPRSETNLCLQGQRRRGSDLLDSTSFNPYPCLDCGLLERIDRNIWNMIVPSHSHIWSTIAPRTRSYKNTVASRGASLSSQGRVCFHNMALMC